MTTKKPSFGALLLPTTVLESGPETTWLGVAVPTPLPPRRKAEAAPDSTIGLSLTHPPAAWEGG